MREALLSVLPIIIAMMAVTLIMPHIMPRIIKHVEIEESKAIAEKEVRTEKAFSIFLRIGLVFITFAFIGFIICLLIPEVAEELKDDYEIILIIFSVSLVGIYILNWVMIKRVKYNNEYCVYINALGIRKKFTYEDITKIKFTLGIVRVSTHKKSFIIFESFPGFWEFFEYIKDKNPDLIIIA